MKPITTWLTTLAFTCIIGEAAAQAPVRLMLAGPQQISGRGYVIDIEHANSIQTAGHGDAAQVVRNARFGFRFTGATAGAGELINVTAKLDSARGSVTSPHGREVIDARQLVGKEIRIAYQRKGGRATYQSPEHAIDFGMFGGAMPLSLPIDYLFVPLSAQPVKPGDSWEHAWTRRQLDGKDMTERKVTARFTLARLESGHGGQIARIEFTARAAADGANGPLEARGHALIGVTDGLVRALQYEDTVSGRWEFGGEMLPFTQTTTIRIAPAAGAHQP